MKRLMTAAAVLALSMTCSTALATTSLSGKYERKLHTTALMGQLNGTWTIAFHNGGYAVTDNGQSVLHGAYLQTGSHITFHDKTGRDACPAAGTYAATVNGDKLTLSPLSDSNPHCIGRLTVLSGTFTKVG